MGSHAIPQPASSPPGELVSWQCQHERKKDRGKREKGKSGLQALDAKRMRDISTASTTKRNGVGVLRPTSNIM
jgi:hypothetical protein